MALAFLCRAVTFKSMTSYILCLIISFSLPFHISVLVHFEPQIQVKKQLKWKLGSQKAMNANYTCNSTTEEPSVLIASHEEALYYIVSGSPIHNDSREHHYLADIHCQLTVHMASPGWTSMLQFIGPVYLAVTDDSSDTLTIYDGEFKTRNILANASGYHESFPIIINNGSEVSLKFDSGGKQRRAGGFQILYSIFREAENSQCAADEFMCDWDRCVPNDFTCDGTKQCLDGSDEGDVCNIPEDHRSVQLAKQLLVLVTTANAIGTLSVAVMLVFCCRVKRRQKRKEIVKAMAVTSFEQMTFV